MHNTASIDKLFSAPKIFLTSYLLLTGMAKIASTINFQTIWDKAHKTILSVNWRLQDCIININSNIKTIHCRDSIYKHLYHTSGRLHTIQQVFLSKQMHTSARFSISHLFSIFIAKTSSVSFSLTTATCKYKANDLMYQYWTDINKWHQLDFQNIWRNEHQRPLAI